jgi:hypothetical protein
MNVRDFQRFRGFLNTVLVELRLCYCDVRLFKKSEPFLKRLKRKCEAFIKIMRLFEDIFREMKVLIINLRLFQRANYEAL